MISRDVGVLLATLAVAGACGAPSATDPASTTQPLGSSSSQGSATTSATGTGTAAGSSATTSSTTQPTGATSTGSTSSGAASGAVEANVLPLTVNGSTCAPGSYLNKPCVSVTVCEPGTPTCQTIDDVLLDTGSYGLRIFSQVLTISLPHVASGGGTLAECAQYAGASADWGPVATAGVVLGGEPAVVTSVQIVDAAFGTVPAGCTGVATGPSDGGFNGILGVGPFVQDCGTGCAISARNGMYYTCSGATCTGSAVPLATQVQNPVALLPLDDNGIVVQLPGVGASGALSVAGALTLGVGTRTNNVPAGTVRAYALDRNGEFTTTLDGTSYSAFLDTGSNGLFFAPPSTLPIPSCPSPDESWFCPPTSMSLQATAASATGAVSGPVSFQIANLLQLLSSGDAVFSDAGGPAPTSAGFDWGLPFFLGKSVYVGFAGRSSTLGSGAYVGF